MKKPLSGEDIKRIFSVKPLIMDTKELNPTIEKLAKSINKKGALANQKYKTFPYWTIEANPAQVLQEYPHLIVLTDVTPDGGTNIKLLKIELDSGRSVFQRTMRKMIEMTGYGLLLCPAAHRFDKFKEAYTTVAKTEKIVTDGIYLGLVSDVMEQGILGPTFTSVSGDKVIFSPDKTPVRDADGELTETPVHGSPTQS